MHYKIQKIEVEGELNTIRVTYWDYGKVRARYKAQYNIKLPAWAELGKLGDRGKLWIYDSDRLKVTITLKSGLQLVYVFSRGFIWDKASVPLFKDNILSTIIPAMVHDSNFSNKYLEPGRGLKLGKKARAAARGKGFRLTNKLFYAMLRYYKTPLPRAVVYYLAVNSIIGRSIYEKCNRADWHGKTVTFKRISPRGAGG